MSNEEPTWRSHAIPRSKVPAEILRCIVTGVAIGLLFGLLIAFVPPLRVAVIGR